MISNFEEKMAAPGFWDNPEQAQSVIGEMNAVKSSVDQYEKLQQEYDDAAMMAELADEEGDEDLAAEIGETISSLGSKVDEFELQLLLNQPYDKLNAILELHPGAGGTESQDCTRCCCGCIPDGLKNVDSRLRCWTTYRVMKRELRVLHYLLKASTPTDI